MDCRHLAALSAATLLLSANAAADVLEIPLKFHKLSELDDGYAFGSAFIQSDAARPEGELKLPELSADQPLFGSARLGESEFFYVIDASEGADGKYDRLYFDRDGDLDLTNDPVIEGDVNVFDMGFYMVDFGEEISVEYLLGGARLPYALSVTVQATDMSQYADQMPEGMEMGWNTYVNVETGCLYAGEVEIGGRMLRLRLSDSDTDGIFGEAAYVDENMRFGGEEIYPQGDYLHVTGADEFTYRDMLLMGDHLIAGGTVYQIAVDIPAGKLLLTPITEGLLPLTLAHEPERLAVHSKGFEHTILMLDPGKTVQVPAGEYRILNYTLTKQGEQGDVWRVGAGATKQSPFVTVGAGEALLQFGEPFAVSVEVPEWYREMFAEGDTDEVDISFAIKGSGGESVQELARISGEESSCEMSESDSSLPAEPTYVIVKSSGERVTQGAFEYG